MSAPDPTHGHTPPEPEVAVAPGLGERLATWTLAAMAGESPTADDAADARALARVVAAVDALVAHAPAGGWQE